MSHNMPLECRTTRALVKSAWKYEAVLVMGCESARCTVDETLGITQRDVLLAMKLVGITNARLKFEFPLNVRLDQPSRIGANEQAG